MTLTPLTWKKRVAVTGGWQLEAAVGGAKGKGPSKQLLWGAVHVEKKRRSRRWKEKKEEEKKEEEEEEVRAYGFLGLVAKWTWDGRIYIGQQRPSKIPRTETSWKEAQSNGGPPLAPRGVIPQADLPPAHRHLAPLHQGDAEAQHLHVDFAQEGEAVEDGSAVVPAVHREAFQPIRDSAHRLGQGVGAPALEVVDEVVEGAVVGVPRDHALVEGCRREKEFAKLQRGEVAEQRGDLPPLHSRILGIPRSRGLTGGPAVVKALIAGSALGPHRAAESLALNLPAQAPAVLLAAARHPGVPGLQRKCSR